MAVLRRIWDVTLMDQKRNVHTMNALTIDGDVVQLLQMRRPQYWIEYLSTTNNSNYQYGRR